MKAKGLYSLIQSLITIPGVKLYIWKIRNLCKEGDKAFDGAWKELKDTGYLKQYRIPKGDKGAFIYEYDLLFEPDLSTPATINLNKSGEAPLPSNSGEQFDHTPQNGGDGMPNTPESAAAKIDHCPQNGGDGQKGQGSIDHTPHFGPGAKSTSCLKHPVLNGGDNSNTPSGNTPVGNTLSVSLPPEGTDRSTDELRNKILDQIEYDWIEENRPHELHAVDSLVDCMVEMESQPFTKVSGVKQSRYALKKRLDGVAAEEILGFLDHMRGIKTGNIRNIGAYWKSAFINYLGEQDLALSTI